MSLMEATEARDWIVATPEEYHLLDAYGSSAIRCFILSGPLEFYVRYIALTKATPERDAFRPGRAFHAAMEGDADWQSRYEIIPTKICDERAMQAANGALALSGSDAAKCVMGEEINNRLKSHKIYMDFIKERAARDGKDFLTSDELEIVKRQVEAVFDNPACVELLGDKTDLMSEVACVYHHESGETAKALIDRTSARRIIDFKTTHETTPAGFAYEAHKLGYAYQMGHYCFVTAKATASIISVNKTYPFEAHAWDIPQPQLVGCVDRAESALRQIAQMKAFSALDDKDSQGIPVSFHNAGWGARLPLDREKLERLI